MLDPIDGTRGFLKGRDALYVVGFIANLFAFVEHLFVCQLMLDAKHVFNLNWERMYKKLLIFFLFNVIFRAVVFKLLHDLSFTEHC